MEGETEIDDGTIGGERGSQIIFEDGLGMRACQQTGIGTCD